MKRTRACILVQLTKDYYHSLGNLDNAQTHTGMHICVHSTHVRMRILRVNSMKTCIAICTATHSNKHKGHSTYTLAHVCTHPQKKHTLYGAVCLHKRKPAYSKYVHTYIQYTYKNKVKLYIPCSCGDGR